MRRITFGNSQFYHIYNRGVEKRDIFSEDGDYLRFIHDLFEFNDEDAVLPFPRRVKNVGGETSYINLPDRNRKKPRKKLVNIVCFCLMPNHFHLILEQLVENGTSKFMQKLGTGYTMFFNTKYERSGVLFQGSFKAAHVDNDTYLNHLSRYIHLNPVELKEQKWKEDGIKDWQAVNRFLENYRWSSYLDYIGKKNFPSITNRELILDIFDNEKKYKKFVREWLAKDFQEVKELILE